MTDASLESVELKFQGKVIRVNVEHVRLPNQKLAQLEIIHHPGGAAIVALNAQQQLCLLKQYRHAAGGYVWELPAGKIDNKEPHADTARRELQEEAGCSADHWHYLGSFFSSPGVFTEIIHLYFATDVHHEGNQPEEHEVFQVNWLTIDEVMAMVTRGEIRDGKTLVALLLAQPFLTGQKA